MLLYKSDYFTVQLFKVFILHIAGFLRHKITVYYTFLWEVTSNIRFKVLFSSVNRSRMSRGFLKRSAF